MGGGTGHPIPSSDEARHHEIPESLEARKGRGDDSRPVVQPGRDATAPDGERYRYDDPGRAENVEDEDKTGGRDGERQE